MKKDYRSLFLSLETARPPKGLSLSILRRIEEEQKHSARIHLFAFAIAACASFVTLFPAFRYAADGFTQSGFYQYLSLVFTDGVSLLPYWKEFALSLAESFPVIPITAFLTVVYILLETIKLAINNWKPAFHHRYG